MDGYEAYTRVNMSAIMDEHKFQRSGFVSDKQIKEIGKATGAKYILIAEVAYFDAKNITVTASIVDIETTKLKATADPEISPIDPDGMRESCIKIARSLLDMDNTSIGSSRKPSRPNGSGNTTAQRPAHNNGVLIYGQSKEDIQFCDGKYEDMEEFFAVDLGERLNREHFRIIFMFEAMDYKGTLVWTTEQYPLVLSRGWRVLAICLHDDGSIYITTNNQEHEYSTGLKYSPGVGKEIDLEYNNGMVTINGVVLNVEMDEYGGDNVLSSINFSSGNAFYGYINSVRVYNIDD